MKTEDRWLLVVAAFGLFLLMGGGKGCELPALTPAKVTAATYFYDDKQHAIPSGVLVAMDKLNRAGIMATHHEVDTTDDSGSVPEQYKVSLPAAKEAGLPALVVMAEQDVVRVVKEPTTEAQVMEAVGHE